MILFQQKLNGKVQPICWSYMCDSIKASLHSSSMEIYQIQWSFFQTFNQNVKDPKWSLDDFWSHTSWGHIYSSTRIILNKSHENTSICVWIQWPFFFFFKILSQKVMTQMPTKASLCTSSTDMYQSMWIQNSFFTTSTKQSMTQRWPLTLRRDFWPHGHMKSLILYPSTTGFQLDLEFLETNFTVWP